MKKVFPVLIIILLATANLFAGTTGKISGRVTDASNGHPLPGANVFIPSLNRGTATDADGFFSLINLPPGNYTVNVKFIGYSVTKIEGVVVSVDRTTKLDTELEEETLEINEIVVQAKRPPVQKDRTYSASVVNTEAIETMPVTSIAEVVQLQPGVVTSGGDLHFRGGRGREVAYLIDGVPVTNSFDQGGGNNVVVENSMVQELEVISGTFNAEYGAAQSGIINIITKGPASKFTGSIQAYAGEWYSSNNDVFLGVDDINPLAEKDIQGSISGPIISDVLSFSFSGRYNNSESLSWYEKRFNYYDSWKIAAYEHWFTEQRADELGSSQSIYIPDSLRTGDMSRGPLATYDNFSGNVKLNYFPFSQVRISYQMFGSYSEQEGSTSSEWRYAPDGAGISKGWSHHHFLSFRHAPSDKFFYNLSASYQFNDGESYYTKDNKYARFYGDSGIQPFTLSQDGFSFGRTGGFYSGADDKGFRETILLSGDFNWQVDKFNFLKAGFEFKKHRVNTYSWGYTETEAWKNTKWLNFDPDPSLTFDSYWQIMQDYWSTWEDSMGTTMYRKYDEDEYTLWRDYTIEPSEIAGYIQDKLELGSIILNAGVRLDVFMPNEKVPVNYQVESTSLGLDANLKDAENKFQVSPRLGVSFPISAGGVFHAAYGHFFQMPSFAKMYNSPLYALTPLQLEGMVLGNADLDPEKTVQYEIGIQQEIIPGIAVDVTAYYKDIKNLLGVEYITTVDNIRYQRYINRDYGNSKGITVGFRKNSGMITGGLNYTYSTANGSSSDPDAIAVIQSSTRIGGEAVEFLDRRIISLDWDQRHTLNAILNIAQAGDWSMGLVGSLWSGQPYTPEFVERYDIPQKEYKNAASKPVKWTLDFKAKKFFKINGLTTAVFLKIDNIFDQLNEEYVFSNTGSAKNNVRLPENEREEIERLAQSGVFTLQEIDSRPNWYSAPRKIQLGFEVQF